MENSHSSRLPYTISEGRLIIRYIIDNQFIENVGGNKLWQKMEAEDVCPGRTWQSMKNHFKRTIIADFKTSACNTKHRQEIWPQYQISSEEYSTLKRAWKFQIDNYMMPRVKRVMQMRSPSRKMSTAKGKMDPWAGIFNPLISSSDEDEDSERKSKIASTSKSLIAVIKMEKTPSTQQESSLTKNASVEKFDGKTQRDQTTSNARGTENNHQKKSSPQYQGANGESGRPRKCILSVSDDNSSSNENSTQQKEQGQGSNQSFAINRRLEKQIAMKKVEKINNGDASHIGRQVAGCSAEGKNVWPVGTKEKRNLSEITTRQKLRKQEVCNQGIPVSSVHDDADTKKSIAPTHEKSSLISPIVKLRKQKHVVFERIDPREMTKRINAKSQEKKLKEADRDLKKKRLKLNPFANGESTQWTPLRRLPGSVAFDPRQQAGS